MADPVRPTNIRHWLSCFSPGQGFLNLISGELQRSTKPNTAGLRSFPSFIRPSLNQVPFKCRQPCQNGNHQLAMWSSRIGPSIGERFELGSNSGDAVQDVKKVSG